MSKLENKNDNISKIELLNVFKNINKNIRNIKEWENIVSTQDHNKKILEPYIPFEGTKYNEYKIILYGTAQNIGWEKGGYRDLLIDNPEKRIERLYYDFSFKKKYPLKNISFDQFGIGPYECGVLPALLSIFIYAKFGKIIKKINKIHDYIAITNYYKYSLHDKKKDINPNNIEKYKLTSKFIKEYLKINDELVTHEINYLKPNYIISFNGRNSSFLMEPLIINDPSWILRGGGGNLSKNGKWEKIAKKYYKCSVNNLVDSYLKHIKNNYENKKNAIKTYLLYYYDQWKEKI
jgi:hypothetical protein